MNIRVRCSFCNGAAVATYTLGVSGAFEDFNVLDGLEMLNGLDMLDGCKVFDDLVVFVLRCIMVARS